MGAFLLAGGLGGLSMGSSDGEGIRDGPKAPRNTSSNVAASELVSPQDVSALLHDVVCTLNGMCGSGSPAPSCQSSRSPGRSTLEHPSTPQPSMQCDTQGDVASLSIQQLASALSQATLQGPCQSQAGALQSDTDWRVDAEELAELLQRLAATTPANTRRNTRQVS